MVLQNGWKQCHNLVPIEKERPSEMFQPKIKTSERDGAVMGDTQIWKTLLRPNL
ncbi:MAG TPA: hypothetical protein VE866_16565 [Candidatus Binatia bacterium]|nr:hypothetical protein [Candidatus Binatia bacterium]